METTTEQIHAWLEREGDKLASGHSGYAEPRNPAWQLGIIEARLNMILNDPSMLDSLRSEIQETEVES